jgi:2-dehydro-3-deoxyphosphogluconate aldolase/(4S)-4-hydroxy-2-oxoglutarate aldolase
VAQFDKRAVIERIANERIVPLFHTADPDAAVMTSQAIVAGGLSIVEFTNRGDRGLAAFTAMASERDAAGSHLIVGVGSVVDPETAAAYVGAGADFIVGPAFVRSVAMFANRRQIPYLPGTSSLTEMLTANENGCEILKMFPGGSGGPQFLKSVRAPCPWLRIMPTGGVSPDVDSMTAWYEAGAFAVGIGSKLVDAASVEAEALDTITTAVARAVAARDTSLARLGDPT